MPAFEDLKTTVTGRIRYEEDFTFPHKKEELALKLRSDYLPKIHKLWAVSSSHLSFDKDGDIVIESEKGSLLVTRDLVVLSRPELTIGMVARGHDTQQIATLLDEVFTSRSPLQATVYGIRLFISLRFKETLPTEIFDPSYFGTIINKIRQELSPSNVRALDWSMTYSEREFSDTFDMETAGRALRLRHDRIAKAETFPSFKEFVTAADLPGIVGMAKLFLGSLIGDPTRIRDETFGEEPRS